MGRARGGGGGEGTCASAPCTGGVARKRTAGSRLYRPARVSPLQAQGTPGSMATASPTSTQPRSKWHSVWAGPVYLIKAGGKEE